MKSRLKKANRIKTNTMKAQKRKARTKKPKVNPPKVLKDSDIPTDLQVGGKTKEKLNDEDCRLFMLMSETKKLRSYEDGKIRHPNSSMAEILQGEFSKSFIRNSLGRLSSEGMIQIQLKQIPTGEMMREITVRNTGITSQHYWDWLDRNSKNIENPFENRNLSADLQIDIDNTDPLTENDFIIFFLIDHFAGGEKGNTVRISNSSISKECKSRYTTKEIYHSLGKLVREGLIQVEVFETAQSTIFREIKVIPGFGTHPDLAKWIADIKQNGVDNRKSSKRQSEEPKTDNSVPYYPLPVEVAWALREIEVIHTGCVDNYIDSANLNPMSRFQHQVFSEGVKNSMSMLKLTQNDWDGIIERSTKMASGEAGAGINLFTHYRFRVHLEALRLLRGKSLMEILYLGEINVQNEFSETDIDLYNNTCEQIWSMVEQNPDMDISQITLGDIENGTKFCA